MRKPFHKIVAIGLGVALALGVVSIAGRQPQLRRKMSRTWAAWFGPAAVSEGQLQVDDPELGWTNLPGTRVRQANSDFDVYYHTRSDGTRRIPGKHPDAATALILGGSFAFGQGVWDKDSFGAQLQRRHWRDMRVRIRASFGWGTGQSYLALRRDLAQDPHVSLVLYVWLPFHNTRNHLSEGWLTSVGQAGQRLPHFVLRDGRPVFDRLVGPEDAVPYDEGLSAKEWEITDALLREMDRISRERSARFIVILAPFEESGPNRDVSEMTARLEAAGIQHLVAHGDMRFDVDDLFFPVDGHPNERWHALLAELTAERIRPGGQ